jgi:hypothetical protein
MQDNASSVVPASKRISWNKRGKLTGAKTPLRQAFIGTVITKPNRRSRQNLGTANSRAYVIDLLARKYFAQQFKDCHGKYA